MINPFKSNFFPRPRDENADFLLTAVIEHNQAAMVSAMCVWNSKLVYATCRNGQLPRLFAWDGSNAVQEMATPPWANPPAAGVTFRINVMANYNGQLWIATSPNVAATPVIEIWYYNGTLWTDAKTDPSWAAAPLGGCGVTTMGIGGAGWMFVFNGIIFIGQDVTGPATGIHVQGWNGTTWLGTVEQVGLGAPGPAAGQSGTPTSRMHAPILSNVVYVGAYDARAGGGGGTGAAEVYTRTTGGTWTLLYTFPNSGTLQPTDPVETLVKINSQIYTAHGGRLGATSGDPLQLACVTSVPTRVRDTNLGFRSGLAVPIGNGNEVALLASPQRLCVFDPAVGNLETVADYSDDAPLDLVAFNNRIYVSQGSEVALLAVPAANAEISIRIARLD